MSNFTPAWFKKGFFNESLFCDDFLSTHQLLYSNGAFFTPDGRMVDPMPLRCEIFEMMREYVGANLAKKVTNVVDVLKLAAQVEDFPPVTDRIALANGTLYLDGTFQEGKECTMESIHNYLTHLRMQHCRKALEEGVSVLNACTESGFPDYSSFLKTFRRLYGITPAEYRAQHRTMVR